MKKIQITSNPPRNAVIFAIGVTALLGIFRLIPLIIVIWVITIAYIVLYQFKSSKKVDGNFVCLDCATIHQQNSCPNCGSKLKKLYSRRNSYGV